MIEKQIRITHKDIPKTSKVHLQREQNHQEIKIKIINRF